MTPAASEVDIQQCPFLFILHMQELVVGYSVAKEPTETPNTYCVFFTQRVPWVQSYRLRLL